jgi:hypothetical protein
MFYSDQLRNKVMGIMRREGIDENNIDCFTDNLINKYI